ncbi:hypothetical protein NDU88_001243 [Pleurodeles waltl]|uniref:Uncharacterized protein n=1 Tax=Pleurodeles waltl TaxID=8319 RepID=A0AAV7NF42_PLEWA|nr:hypothetical protein NDU88_001243 [Pleurodeles waltl]
MGLAARSVIPIGTFLLVEFVLEHLLSSEEICLSEPRIPARRSPGRREPLCSAHTTSARPTGARVPVRSAGAPGVAHNPQDGRVSGQAPHSSPAGRRDRGRHPDFFASVRPDGGVLSPSQVVSHISRNPTHIHGGVRATRSLPPIVRTAVSLRPTGAQAPKRSAGVSGVAHRAAVSAGHPLTSGSAERRSPGRHLGFIEPVAAGVYGSDFTDVRFRGIPGVQEPTGAFGAVPIM